MQAIARLIINIWTPDDYRRFLKIATRSGPGRIARTAFWPPPPYFRQYPCKGGHMSSTRNPGRVAGFLYLLLAVAGPIRILYIPSKLFV